MADDDKQPAAPKEHPAMGQIVGYLKDYPFLLITVAGLLIMSGILIFDIEKLKEFKWLIYAVVLVPLAIQFLIEFKKMQPRHTAAPTPASPATPVSPEPLSVSLSWKAWISMGLCVLLFGAVAATDEAELHDEDFALGFLVVALVAAGFAVAALSDIRNRRTRGKATAVTGLILSVLLSLAGIGWMTSNSGDGGNDTALVTPTTLTPSKLPAAPTPNTAPPRANTLPALEGRYQLMAYQVNNIPQAAGGSLSISRRDADRFHWQTQLTTQDFGGMHHFQYSGQFVHRNGRWFLQVTGSNDPSWRDEGEVPMEVVFDGRTAAFGYRYGGSLVQSAWTRGR